MNTIENTIENTKENLEEKSKKLEEKYKNILQSFLDFINESKSKKRIENKRAIEDILLNFTYIKGQFDSNLFNLEYSKELKFNIDKDKYEEVLEILKSIEENVLVDEKNKKFFIEYIRKVDFLKNKEENIKINSKEILEKLLNKINCKTSKILKSKK